MEKVTILLSTFNGEKYVAEQIDSILNQSYKNIQIFVRDDVSTDQTLPILERLHRDGIIHLTKGKNIGVIDSFFWLMKNAPLADFYAFCDQDDVWKHDKIEKALSELHNYDINSPNLYCSSTELVDENLVSNQVGPVLKRLKPSLGNALVQNIVTGCTAVFNRAALDKCISVQPKRVEMHDSWIYLVCAAFGNVFFDTYPTVLYRQHSQNVIGGKTIGCYQRFVRKFSILFNNPKKNFRSQRANEFLELFPTEFETKELVGKIANYKYSWRNRLALITEKRIFMNRRDQDFIFRLSVLLGQL